jgi:hypothetical protein
MVRRRIEFLPAPKKVEAVRHIAESSQAAYRQSRTFERLSMRVSERSAGERERPDPPLPGFQVAVFFVWTCIGGAFLWNLPIFVLFLVVSYGALFYWVVQAPGPASNTIGYSGTLQIEDGKLVSDVSPTDGTEAVTDLAHVNDVHILHTETGFTLSAKMIDGEERTLANRIADIEVARYLGEQIASASNAAKADASENDGSR